MDDKNTLLILNTIEKFRNETNARFDAQDKRLDIFGNKLDAQDRRLDIFGDKLDAQDRKLDIFGDKLDAQDKRLDIFGDKLDAQGKKIDSHDENFKEIKERLTSLENTVTRIETVFGDKIQIGLEHHSILIDQHNDIMQSLDKINSKLDNHDIRIEILEEKVL